MPDVTPTGSFRAELKQALEALVAINVLPGSYNPDANADDVIAARDRWIQSHGNAIKQLLEQVLVT